MRTYLCISHFDQFDLEKFHLLHQKDFSSLKDVLFPFASVTLLHLKASRRRLAIYSSLFKHHSHFHSFISSYLLNPSHSA
jgi:hypothetical protein